MGSDQFEFDGRGIAFERGEERGVFRILVDGAPIAMTFAEVETTDTNSGEYRKLLLEEAPAKWIRLGRALPEQLDFAPTDGQAGGCLLHVHLSLVSGAVYNTVVYDSKYLSAVFAPDYSAVAVTMVHHTDTTT
ncbi:hypothetical protein JK358_25710 [Nocardia sp. 2]|uniref:Uncharacterized protein n=1 Tax=Nocardia acididurans TaxID=2802282 RepID=A0ABS1MB79_9NOCA|nr:hypothetical protein [Nocardia acididurans]MBL1077804.1 hypothetical protein [Nocardia acididurans]